MRVGWMALDPLRATLHAHSLHGLLGIPDGPFEAATLAMYVDPADAARVIDSLSTAAHGEPVIPLTVHTRPRDGVRRALSVAFRRVDGPPLQVVAVVRDAVGDERRSEELRLARAACD